MNRRPVALGSASGVTLLRNDYQSLHPVDQQVSPISVTQLRSRYYARRTRGVLSKGLIDR